MDEEDEADDDEFTLINCMSQNRLSFHESEFDRFREIRGSTPIKGIAELNSPTNTSKRTIGNTSRLSTDNMQQKRQSNERN